jgi:hypothetical protein
MAAALLIVLLSGAISNFTCTKFLALPKFSALSSEAVLIVTSFTGYPFISHILQ